MNVKVAVSRAPYPHLHDHRAGLFDEPCLSRDMVGAEPFLEGGQLLLILIHAMRSDH